MQRWIRTRRCYGVALAACLLSACGHDVTPEPANPLSDLAGDMQVKFQVAAPMDFQNTIYVIAIDMCGSGVPYPKPFVTGSYTSYTFAFSMGGTLGTAQPLLYQYSLSPTSSGTLSKFPVPIDPAVTQFTYPYEGQSTEFAFTFPRRMLNDPLTIAAPCPGGPPISKPSANATLPPNVSASTGVYVPPYLTHWTFNMMTFSAGAAPEPLDSLGQSGANDDNSPGIVVDTGAQGQYPESRVPGSIMPSSQAAFITYAEVDTY